jgi:hypothetical protein
MNRLRTNSATFILLGFLLSACGGMEPLETVEKCKTDIITPTGIFIDKGKQPLNFYFMKTSAKVGVTSDQLLSSLNVKKEEKKNITESQVIVDMSAGMNVGIEKSYTAISAVMKRLVPGKTKYYHVDDDANAIQPINEIKSLSDASVLTNPENFKKANSMLKPAFQAATKATDKISVIVTDFLLDEGVKGGQRLKNGKYTKEETANNSTWAKDYFTEWFAGGNRIVVYPFKYTATNYYKKSENKYIYYIIFEPKNTASSDLDNLKNDLKSTGLFTDIVDINPVGLTLAIDEKNQPGDCVEDYKMLKGFTKPKALQVFPEYSTQHIPFSYPKLKGASYSDKPIACNLLINNQSPFKPTIAAEGYDLSDYYYETLAISQKEWEEGKRPRDYAASGDLVADIANDSAITYKFASAVTGVSYMAKYKGLAKLLYSKISVKDITLKELSPALSWDFESKEGTMENNALKESIHLALDEYIAKNKNFQIGSILVSVHDK